MQDLETHLQRARQQIVQLKDLLGDKAGASTRTHMQSSPSTPEIESGKERNMIPRAMSGFFRVRRNIRNYGRDIFQPPYSYRTIPMGTICSNPGPVLPPKPIVDLLLVTYKNVVHSYAPVLHWPTFEAEVQSVYQNGDFRGVREVWIATLFAVLACGTMSIDVYKAKEMGIDGTRLINTAIYSINSMSDVITVDNARAALMISIYLFDMNLRSVASVWLGTAVRAAQECGLHMEVSPASVMQAEVRRRVWWSIYNFDRLFSLESCVPLAIAESEIDVLEPQPIDDALLGPDGYHPTATVTAAHNLKVLAAVVKVIYPMKRTLKAQSVTPAALKIYDGRFEAILATYPEVYRANSTMPLDPLGLYPAIALHICRIMLYRHNMSVVCRPLERQDAIRRCLQVAKETAHIIFRTTLTAQSQQPRLALHPPDMSSPEWRARTRLTCPPFVCTHLWRCILILALCGEFGHALTCAGVMSAIGIQKKVNTACGRHLAFYLARYIQIIETDKTVADVQHDEEMLAYASGDLQGEQNSAWAWTGSDTRGPALPESEVTMRQPSPSDRNGMDTSEIHGSNTPLAEEEIEWGGWQRVEYMLRTLDRVCGQFGGAGPRDHVAPDSAPPLHRTEQPYYAMRRTSLGEPLAVSHQQAGPPLYQSRDQLQSNGFGFTTSSQNVNHAGGAQTMAQPQGTEEDISRQSSGNAQSMQTNQNSVSRISINNII